MADHELIELAEDREIQKWRLEVNSLKLGSIANPGSETVVSVFTKSSALGPEA